MASVQEMTKDLSGLLGIEVPNVFNVTQVVKTADQALIAGRFLQSQIAGIEDNKQFCTAGENALKQCYNQLCNCYPLLVAEVGPAYKI